MDVQRELDLLKFEMVFEDVRMSEEVKKDIIVALSLQMI